MIGVLPKPGQLDVVEEFFELFKTPWEIYRPGRTYDIVIVTADEIPEVQTKLLLVCGAATRTIDVALETAPAESHRCLFLTAGKSVFPTYGETRLFEPSASGIPCVTASSRVVGLRIKRSDSIVMRLGYDLFEEVRLLLAVGQPVENAEFPTLDTHIRLLRDWILHAGLSLLEIPPVPSGHRFTVCLTHDIDFIGIKNHLFDHSMFGFALRAMFGSVHNFLRGRLSFSRLLRNWIATLSLPLVYAGWAKDFWEPFEWYLDAEKDLPATYFLIPFKRRPGTNVDSNYVSRRATAYDIGDLPQQISMLLQRGCEVGVHGIDSWHDPGKGREELSRTAAVTNTSRTGIRMHWLLRDDRTPVILENAGYYYDSTLGYNETIGYRSGTSQVFRPLGATKLFELPLHIQDGALFFPQRLGLSDTQADTRCQPLIDNALASGGVLTVLWHDRSHGPERFWGDFYLRLIAKGKVLGAWFATGAQAVGWFEKRRSVRFERCDSSDDIRSRVSYQGEEIVPPLTVRFYPASSTEFASCERKSIDIPWTGRSVDQLNDRIVASSAALPEVNSYSHS